MTETTTMTLAEFLLESIAEDEAAIRELLAHDDWYPKGDPSPTAETAAIKVRHWTLTPARVLAECEAKRRIIEAVRRQVEERTIRTIPLPKAVLLALALPCADRPGFREEWHDRP